MKKLLTSLFLASALGFGTLSAGQVYFEDDFSNGLTKWTTVDGDGLTMNEKASQNLGLSTPEKISWKPVKLSNGNTIALSCSYYEPAGAADDWLISPEIEIGDQAVLEWSAQAYDESYPDGYKVYISTTGADVANFTTEIYSTKGEAASFTKRFVDLAKLNFKNQKIRIAFQNNSNDKVFLFLDDVKVHVPAKYDLQLTYVQAPNLFKAGVTDPITFPIYIQNNCFYGTLTSFDLTYQADGEEPVKTTITNPTNTYSKYGLFNVATPWNPTTLGNRKVTFTVSNINGTNETDDIPTDNTFETSTLVWDNTAFADVFPLYESFTSATCGPCAAKGSIFNPILDASAEKMCLIKYQMDWPGNGDIYYNADGGMRKDYYQVTGVPAAYTNGNEYDLYYNGNANLTQAALDKAILGPALFDIVTPTYSIKDNTVSVKADIKCLSTLTGADITAHIGVFEFKTTKNKSTNGETEFHHVMQKMLPNGNGTKVTALAKDAVQPLSYEYEFTSTDHVEEMDDLGVVVFVQEKTGKMVMQSAYAVKTGPNSVPYVEDGNGVVGLYPNPAKESAQLKYSIKGDKNVTVELFDLAGNSVYFADKGLLSTGYYNENFNLASVANGQYFVRLNIGGRMFTDVITVSK